MKTLNYTVVIIPNDPDGYLVTCPALFGLVTEGDTLDEARDMARAAIAGYLESLALDNEPLPVDVPVITEAIHYKY